MNGAYYGCMETTIVQVRDVPVSVLATLKARAEAQGVSLSAFLRDLMASEAAMPPIGDVMATIASREPVNYETEDLRSLAADGRR
jgi:antitoxin FitA